MGTYSSRTGNCKSVRQVFRHVVSFKHQGEQARPGEQATPQELAKPEPPELFLMLLSNMEQFCAAEAQLKNSTNRTLPEKQLVSLRDSKNLQKVVREMVGRLFSKQVQEQFSLLGYRGKSRFKDAMMCNVVIGALRTRLYRQQFDPAIDSVDCGACGQEDDTISHLVLHCTGLTRKWDETRRVDNQGLSQNNTSRARQTAAVAQAALGSPAASAPVLPLLPQALDVHP
ncbi:hypothetical protein HPB47_012476 [Ixodes persulcatus]|uniref:Uncharacterized protein n=1 Tax=Ixodes persulcatus TaxID=34615 RepID=A0AC60NTH3_IXOPE|nr:hypothetical protein HPB47_012476 [Ixodes persulcatus]